MSRRQHRLVRWAGVAGIAASVSYAIGDVLLLGQEVRPERHPRIRDLPGVDRGVLSMVPSSTARLTAGAMAGVYATPLYLAAVWHLYHGLAPAGRRTALPPTLILAGAWTWASFIHGSFFHTGETYKALETVADDPQAREVLVAQGKSFQRATGIAYAPLGAAFLAASGLIIAAIRSGRTAYPRWSAPLVAPALPIVAATAATATHVLPGRARHTLQGAGISLGNLISFTASTILLWRDRNRERARG